MGGQGAIFTCLRAMYQAYVGQTLIPVIFGKPSRATYNYCTKVLLAQARELGHSGIDDFWGIGDNPKGDVHGANLAQWNSGLVRTGVAEDDHPDFPATRVFEDFPAAVLHILGQKYANLTR